MASDLKATAIAGYDLSQKNVVFMALTLCTNSNINNRFFPLQTQLRVFAVAAHISTSATEDFNKLWPLKIAECRKRMDSFSGKQCWHHEPRGGRTWVEVRGGSMINSPTVPNQGKKRVEKDPPPHQFFGYDWSSRQPETIGLQLHVRGSEESLFSTYNEGLYRYIYNSK